MSSLIRREGGEGTLSVPEDAERLPSPFWGRSGMTPAMDVYETDEDVVVKVAIPGIDPDDIDVTMQENTLIIKGEIEREEETVKEYVRRERSYGRFCRSLTLPGLSADEAKAEYENGVLTLNFPKQEEERSKRIRVESR